jgi:hypothetical protein
MNKIALAGLGIVALAFAAPAYADVAGIGPFVGNWKAHWEDLTVNADGTGEETYEDTSSCPDAPLSGCGVQGVVSFRIARVSGSKASGSITGASNPQTPVGARVRLKLVNTGPAPGQGLQLDVGGQGFDNPTGFCKLDSSGNKVNDYYCGA